MIASVLLPSSITSSGISLSLSTSAERISLGLSTGLRGQIGATGAIGINVDHHEHHATDGERVAFFRLAWKILKDQPKSAVMWRNGLEKVRPALRYVQINGIVRAVLKLRGDLERIPDRHVRRRHGQIKWTRHTQKSGARRYGR